MKRGNQFTGVSGAAGTAEATSSRPDGVVDADAAADQDGSALLREAVRETEPFGAFDARAIKELQNAAPTDPRQLRRTIRRSELRQIVPLADSTIYELVEWAAAMTFGGDLGAAYLGTQGDPWDAQRDMALAAAGSTMLESSRMLPGKG